MASYVENVCGGVRHAVSVASGSHQVAIYVGSVYSLQLTIVSHLIKLGLMHSSCVCSWVPELIT